MDATLGEDPVALGMPRSRRKRRIGREAVLRCCSVCGFFLVWAGICALNRYGVRMFNPLLFPSPGDVLLTGQEMVASGELLHHLPASLSRVIQGFLVAAVLGVGVGVLVGRSHTAEYVIDPIVQMLRPIPPLAFLPILVLWFGIGEASKVVFIAYATFFPIFTTTVDGMRTIDRVLLRAAASLGAKRFDLFRYVVLPSALPNILTGLRIGFGLAFFVIVAAEFIAADAGLGFLINDARIFFMVPRMLLAAATIGLVGFLFNVALRRLEGWLLRWRRDERA